MEPYIIPIIAFSVFLVISSLMCLCFFCIAKKFRSMAPVVVTSATHTAPGGYPVTQLPPPGYPASNAYVAPVAYPAQPTGNVTVQMPMPMPQHIPQQMPMPGMQTHGVAYPQYPGAGAASMNPPPYDMAMANPGPSVMPSGYEKQAPYNPNFGQ
ncbi:MAPK-interacting and spindle-stabilizing protein-like isoform X3 [Drosophila biarmipes]|uniref:MAPK-interacting and spindle-stabilizing protein-like isoform X3 n=1 Tax=Drosophila biarmipes TaxID=125945 RepID=UPI0007E61FC9|nr:MAPK-interacting and spindle-stabilizing protein-like isoform X3 [Drosophila biarmipes]